MDNLLELTDLGCQFFLSLDELLFNGLDLLFYLNIEILTYCDRLILLLFFQLLALGLQKLNLLNEEPLLLRPILVLGSPIFQLGPY